MANRDFPRGLVPLEPDAPMHRYTIPDSYASNLFVGDPVVTVLGGGINIATGGATNKVLGAIAAIFDADGKPATYFPTGSDGYTCMVYDDPYTRFVIQEDADAANVALADRGATCNLVAGTGNTTTGLSGWELESSEVDQDATDQVKIEALHDAVDNAVGSGTSDHGDWVVTINLHDRAKADAGI